MLSCEVTVVKNSAGKVVSGTYRKRKGRVWETKKANTKKIFPVIRKRAVHKATLEAYQTAFTRCITWVMPLEEYNRLYPVKKDMKECRLSCPNIVVHYYFNTGRAVPTVGEKHCNAKRNAFNFRPRKHLLKQSCKDQAKKEYRAPRLVCQEMQDTEDLLASYTESSVIRD